MKKILSILIATILLTSLCACSQQRNQESQPTGTASAQTEAVPAAQTNPSEQPVSTAISQAEALPSVAPQRISSPERIQATWLSNTGKTQISVDAEVQIGEVGLLPVYEVCPRLVTKDEVSVFANAIFEDGSFAYSEPFINAQDMANFEGIVGGGKETKRVQLAKDIFVDEPVKKISFYTYNQPDCFLQFEFMHDADEVIYDTSGSVWPVSMLTKEQAQAFPFQNALDTANRAVSAFMPEFECTSYGFRKGYYWYDESHNNTNITGDGTIAYVFYYTRPYAGIQTTYTETDCIAPVSEGRDGIYISNVSYESIEVMVSQRGIEFMIYRTPHDAVGVLSHDAQILPFDEILSIAEQVLPLRLASWEQSGGANAAVDRIEFGYMRVRMRDEPTKFMMIPVWDFFGSEYRSNSEDELIIPNQSLLTISAIDGTVIDRSYGY